MCLKPVVLFLSIFFVHETGTWKAIPASKALYGYRSNFADYMPPGFTKQTPDELLPRTAIHSIYKFGWCRADSIRPQYLRRVLNVSVVRHDEAQVNFLYFMDRKNSARYALQCIIMKTYVPNKYLLRRSRFPIFYCQGFVYKLVWNTYQKIDIHEFYLFYALNMPASFSFEFYLPTFT